MTSACYAGSHACTLLEHMRMRCVHHCLHAQRGVRLGSAHNHAMHLHLSRVNDVPHKSGLDVGAVVLMRPCQWHGEILPVA